MRPAPVPLEERGESLERVPVLLRGPAVPVQVLEPQAPRYQAGGEVQTGQAGGEGGDLVMEMTRTGKVNVTISAQLTGYNFKWDGTGKLSLIDLEPGAYRVLIRADGETIGLHAEVEKGRACAYRYIQGSGGDEWDEAGC